MSSPEPPDAPADPTGSTDPPVEHSTEVESDWQRRRRLAAVFGDVLPEQSSDDRDDSSSQAGKGDGWYRDQVPPHHG